jgi:hypothetical protein
VNKDEADEAKEEFSEIETQEEEKLLERGGSVKKPDSPEKQGMCCCCCCCCFLNTGRDTELFNDIAFFVVLRGWYVKQNKVLKMLMH